MIITKSAYFNDSNNPYQHFPVMDGYITNTLNIRLYGPYNLDRFIIINAF